VPIYFQEPIKTFRFLVEVVGGSDKLVAAFTRFSGVNMKVDIVRHRPGSEKRGVADNIPALTSFENVRLMKGVIGDNEFLEWIQSVAPGPEAAPTGKAKYRTINVIALDDKRNRAVTWSLISAIPVAYELGEMDSTQSAVLSESLEFSIKGFLRETNQDLNVKRQAPAARG